MRDAGLVHLARQLPHDPVARGLGVAGRGGGRLEVGRDRGRLRQQRRRRSPAVRTARRSAGGAHPAAPAGSAAAVSIQAGRARAAAGRARGSSGSRAPLPCCASTASGRRRCPTAAFRASTRPPPRARAVCRSISYSSARWTWRNELRFLTSALTPNALCRRGRTETLASQRRLPSSMLPSVTPVATRIARSRLKNSAASAAERRSGWVTISISGTPLRLKSRPVDRDPSRRSPSCSDLPASSSRWTRMIPTRRASPRASNSSAPSVASGRSYWEIW